MHRVGFERLKQGLWRAGVAVLGGALLLVGLALLVLPGPGMLVIPLGLGVLGLEFAWARRWLVAVQERSRAVFRGVRDGAAPTRGR